MSDKKNLIAKINAAAVDVGGKLKADKQNQDQHYSYISADKTLSVIGQALYTAGVAVLPSVTESRIEVFEYTDSYGKTKRRYDATVTFMMLMTDGESDFTLPWRGMGSDFTTPDKAIYKAITSGHKYFLLKLLCIGEGNEDGEHEEPPAEKPAARANGRDPVPPPEPPDDFGMVDAAREELGATVTEPELEAALNRTTAKGKPYRECTDDQLAFIVEKGSPDSKRAAQVVLDSRKS